MKIDQDLRIAIRSAVASKPMRYAEKEKLKDEAIAELLKKSKFVAGQARQLIALEKQYSAIKAKIDAIEGTTGMRLKFNGKLEIEDEAAFRGQGGKLPENPNMSYDDAMSLVAAAPDQKSLNVILKKLGINWK